MLPDITRGLADMKDLRDRLLRAEEGRGLCSMEVNPLARSQNATSKITNGYEQVMRITWVVVATSPASTWRGPGFCVRVGGACRRTAFSTRA